MATPNVTPNPTIPTGPATFLDPTGTARVIPPEQQQAAIAAGGKQAVKMLDPTGTARWIPAEQQQAAIAAGGKLAPATAAPSSPAAPPPPTDAPSLWQRTRQHIAENIDSNLQPTGGIADDVVGGLSRGFAKGGLQSVGGLLDIYRKLGSDTMPDTAAAADWFKKHSQADGFWENVGAGGEALAELLGTEGVGSLVSEAAKSTEAGAKVLSVADRLKSSGQVASFLTANPKIAKLAAIGMRVLHSGAQAGAQSYIKSGGDVGTAAEGAALGAAGGAAVEGISAAARGTKNVAVSTLERLARPGETNEAVTNAAKGIVHEELTKTNAIRTPKPGEPKIRNTTQTPPTMPATATGLPGEVGMRNGLPGGSEAAAPATVTTEPIPTEGAPEVSEPRPWSASRALPGETSPAGETQAVARPGPSGISAKATTGATGIGPQATEETVGARYKRIVPDQPETPRLPQIDVQKAVNETGSFADARDRLHEAAKPVYDHLNKISHGEWQADWNNLRAARDKRFTLSRGVDDDEIARQDYRIKFLSDKIRDLIRSPESGLSQEDMNQAIANFRTGYVLDEAHRRIGSIYDVAAGRPLKSGTYQGIGTSRVGEQWRQFIKDTPDAREIIGGDRVDTLQRLFDLNETRASRRQIGTAIYSIARHVVPGGHGVVGHVADGAIRKVIHGLISDPKTAKSLMFAIDSGAKPENYAPGLAKMIRRKLINAAIPAAASTMAHD